jgi:zinc/manganese transport system ATP-binding protein
MGANRGIGPARCLAVPVDAPLLQARQLTFGYGAAPVLQAIDLDVPKGSCTLIRGDNGAGKSTLLHLLQGKVQPTAGWVRLSGRPLRGQRRRLALVPQAPSLRWHYPINLAGLVGIGCGDQAPRTDQALHQVGLAGLAHAPIAALSGGQRQRALIALALASQAEVLLLDEPFACLDDHSRLQLGELIQALVASGTAVVLTAHGTLPNTLPQRRVLHLQQGQLKQTQSAPGGRP